MITTILQGGMGNQMFQFSMGLARARRLNTELQLDVSLLGVRKHRQYVLNQWGIKNKTVFGTSSTVREQGMSYNSALTNSIKDGDVLSGYWQTEKYFNLIQDDLRSIFVTPVLLFDPFRNSVAVHVRRTDYLREPHKSFHGILGMDYYKTAMNCMREWVSNPKFFIFSDEPEWAKENFPGEHIVERGLEATDISFMSLCKHAIIANSSFSWWGAWLGDQKSNRVVIAPKKWFDKANEDYSDVVPDRWIKI